MLHDRGDRTQSRSAGHSMGVLMLSIWNNSIWKSLMRPQTWGRVLLEMARKKRTQKETLEKDEQEPIKRLMAFIWRENEWEIEMRRCWSGGMQRWSKTLKVKIERERYITFQWQWD